MKKLSKRKYPGLAVINTGGKWFTGWEGDAFTKEKEISFSTRYPHADMDHIFSRGAAERVEVIEHEAKKLRLQFSFTGKGRSSAVAVFKDVDGFEYSLTLFTLEKILQLLHWKRDPNTKYDISETRIQGSGTWIEGTFMQVKKGQNYFIAPAEVENE